MEATERVDVALVQPQIRIDINSASVQDLMTIRGIGSRNADTICRHRPFRSFREIAAVKGIGSGSVLERLMAYTYIDGEDANAEVIFPVARRSRRLPVAVRTAV